MLERPYYQEILLNRRDPQGLFNNGILKFRFWYWAFEKEFKDRAVAQTSGGYYIPAGNVSRLVPVPEITAFMWKIRALYLLASLHGDCGDHNNALAAYREIYEDYAFIHEMPIFATGRHFYWEQETRRQIRTIFDTVRNATGQYIEFFFKGILPGHCSAR